MNQVIASRTYTEQQHDYIMAYALALERHREAINDVQRTLRTYWLDEQIADLNEIGVPQKEADAYLATRRLYSSEYLFVDLDEEGAPTEAWCRALTALRVASARIGRNNYQAGLYGNAKFKRHKPYSITEAHQSVINAMYDLQSGKITPEEAMALLQYDYDVMKQRLGK